VAVGLHKNHPHVKKTVHIQKTHFNKKSMGGTFFKSVKPPHDSRAPRNKSSQRPSGWRSCFAKTATVFAAESVSKYTHTWDGIYAIYVSVALFLFSGCHQYVPEEDERCSNKIVDKENYKLSHTETVHFSHQRLDVRSWSNVVTCRIIHAAKNCSK
jgi:hypothetical protein